MASLQVRNGSYRVPFPWHGKFHAFTIFLRPFLPSGRWTHAALTAAHVNEVLKRVRKALKSLMSMFPSPLKSNGCKGDVPTDVLNAVRKSLKSEMSTCAPPTVGFSSPNSR